MSAAQLNLLQSKDSDIPWYILLCMVIIVIVFDSLAELCRATGAARNQREGGVSAGLLASQLQLVYASSLSFQLGSACGGLPLEERERARGERETLNVCGSVGIYW